MSRVRALIALISFSLFALISTTASAQYTIQQCTWTMNQITQSIEERSSKNVISLERHYLTYCKERMQAGEYLTHLEVLATSLNDDGQHQESLGIVNRCLGIDATDLLCLNEKASAYYSLGHYRDARAVIKHSNDLGATTELDVAVKNSLRQLALRIDAALREGTPGGANQEPTQAQIFTNKAPAGASGRVTCSRSSVGISLDITGEINAKTTENVNKLFDQYHEQQKKVASGLVCDDTTLQNPPDFSAQATSIFRINSRGGDIAAAMAIGRVLRKEHAWLTVDGVCFSACVLILAGAVDRRIGESGKVGIHRPYFTSTPETPVKSDQVKEAYLRVLQDMRSYLREMGIPQRLADDMLVIEPENNHVLSIAELRSYRLAGVDSAEQQNRTIEKEALDVQEANQLGLDRREYTRRKALGESICTNTNERDADASSKLDYSSLVDPTAPPAPEPTAEHHAQIDYSEINACKQRVLKTGHREVMKTGKVPELMDFTSQSVPAK